MRWFGRGLLYVMLAVTGVFAALYIGSELVTAHEIRTTGSTSRADLADDYGLPILMALWVTPEVLGGAAAGVVGAWLLIRLFERLNGRCRDRVSAYLDSFFLGIAVGLGMTGSIIALHVASGPSLAAVDLLLLEPGARITARFLGPPSDNSFRWVFTSMAISGLINGMFGACIGLLLEKRSQHRHRRALD